MPAPTPQLLETPQLETVEQKVVEQLAHEATNTGHLDLNALPPAVRASAMFALAAFARGERVTTLVTGSKDLTSTQAADVLGVSRAHLMRMCDEGRIGNYKTGSHLRIPVPEITRILAERSRAMAEARQASATADQRRRDRAARKAGLT